MVNVRPAWSNGPSLSPVERDQRLRTRIVGEFREMPGMRLTFTQAARLFSLEREQCARILQSLVETGELWTDGRQYFRDVAGAS